MRASRAGEDVVLVIDVQGARQVRHARHRDASAIFVLPPSAAVLEQRLRGRSKDSEEQIRRRLEVARKEVAEFDEYEYAVVNDELEAAVERLRAIVLAERARVKLMRPVGRNHHRDVSTAHHKDNVHGKTHRKKTDSSSS